MKKRILITHAFGPDNRGDHELLVKLITVIRNSFGADSQIEVFTSFPEKSSNVIIDANVRFYKSPISFAGLKRNLKSYLRLSWDVFGYLWYILTKSKIFLRNVSKAKIEIVKGSDYIFYCPGGYLFSNGKSYYVNVLNGLILKHAKIPVYFSPMSIGPFYNKFDHTLCKVVLRTATKIFARESFSFDLVKNAYKFQNVYHTTDLAWYQSDIEVFTEDLTWKGHYVITILDWNYNDVGKQEYHKEKYFKEIIQCCKRLFLSSQKKVILYNQVGTGKGESKDERLIRKIVNEISNIVQFEEEELRPEQLKSRLHYCNGLVASRFHSALFAIQASVPFISLSYQPKAEFILKDLGLQDVCRRIYEFDGSEVAESLIDLYSNKELFGTRIRSVKRITQEALSQNFIEQL